MTNRVLATRAVVALAVLAATASLFIVALDSTG